MPERVITDLEAPLNLYQLRTFNQRESVPRLQHLLRQEYILNTSKDLQKMSWLLAKELLQGPLVGFEYQ